MPEESGANECESDLRSDLSDEDEMECLPIAGANHKVHAKFEHTQSSGLFGSFAGNNSGTFNLTLPLKEVSNKDQVLSSYRSKLSNDTYFDQVSQNSISKKAMKDISRKLCELSESKCFGEVSADAG